MLDIIADTVNSFSRLRAEPWVNLGNVLLVGEGNLSFARNLLNKPMISIESAIATTFEAQRNLSDETLRNTSLLRCCGVRVIHRVDATRLDQNFKGAEFDTIIFQFPNVGSRDAKYGRNPNHVMIRKFLRSAATILKPSGKILISAVGSPHYQGAFQFDDAAAFAGYETPEAYPFDPSLFPGYSHTNTNDDESALDNHSRFATWIFRLKK